MVGKGLNCGIQDTNNPGFFWWGKLPAIYQGAGCFQWSTNLKKTLEVARGTDPHPHPTPRLLAN